MVDYDPDEWERPIIIDNGTGVVKAGLAGEPMPSLVFKSVIGEPIVPNEEDEGKVFIGDDCAPLQGYLKLRYPLAHGSVQRWDDVERLWEHCFEELDVDPKYHPVLLTEPPMNAKSNREQMTEIMFEKYRVPALYVAVQAVLALYASGRTTGIVLDVGDGVSHAVPIYDGYSMQHGVGRVDVAGRELTDYMRRLLLLKGYQFTTSAEFEIVREIKEQLCFVRPTADEEPKKDKRLRKKYEMPGGDDIIIDEERWRCPEALFRPSEIGREVLGISDMLFKSINDCDIDLRRELYQNIVLSGGSTMFPGMAERLTWELQQLAPGGARVKVTDPPERLYSVWAGGSILADLSTFRNMMVTSMEYYEQGTVVIHRKCY